MTRSGSFLLLLFALSAPTALHSQNTTRATPAVDPTKIKRNPDVISREEIDAAADAQTAWDLVKRLRPSWLTAHGGSMHLQVAGVQVYVNEVRQGGAGALEEIPRTGVKEIRHLRGSDATQRYGTGHENGAILVFLK